MPIKWLIIRMAGSGLEIYLSSIPFNDEDMNLYLKYPHKNQVWLLISGDTDRQNPGAWEPLDSVRTYLSQ